MRVRKSRVTPRKRAKRHEARAKRAREADAKRRKYVVEKYGERASACARKNRYKTRDIAERFAGKYEIGAGKRLYSYRCPYCNGWHLTSHPKESA